MQYALGRYALMVGACIAVLAIEFFIYTNAMSKCIKQSLFAISKSKGHSGKIREQFIEFLEYHTRVKQLSSTRLKFHFILSKLIINLHRSKFLLDVSTNFRNYFNLLLLHCLFGA